MFLPKPAFGAFALVLPFALFRLGAEAPAAPAEPGFAALGEEVVRIVRDELYDPERGARWAAENAGYAAGIADAGIFRAETRRRLAALGVSHTEYHRPDDPGYWGLLSIFAPVLKLPAEVDSAGLAAAEVAGGWHVERAFAGGPAEKAGLRRGDRLLAADGEPFHPWRSFAGKAGRPVALEVRGGPDEAPRKVEVVPRRIDPQQEWLEAQRAGSRVLESGGRRIGYVPVWSCAGAKPREVLEETLAGDLAAAEALILDLRGGWGGCDFSIVDLFNPMQPTLTRIDRQGKRADFSLAWRKSLVVLVDGGSRSGKEVVARAIQRHDLGTLVGERTAGAVVAGKPFVLADGSLLYLAVEDVLVDGERLEGVGVTPDLTVAADLPYARGKDPQLERALEVAAVQAGPPAVTTR